MGGAVIVIHLKSGEESVPVQYNPPEYSIGWSARYAEKKSLGQNNKKEFTGEEAGSLKFSLTIDGFTKANTDAEKDAADVSSDVEKLKSLLHIDAELHRPPECTFKWGTLQFRGRATSLNVRYTMFSSEGKPIRATVDIAITQSENKKLALESPDRTKRRVLTQDTELYMLANEVYDDPAAWRQIAAANGIKNPRMVETGMVLRVPPLEAVT